MTQITKMLRLIVRDHPHHTGHSDAYVFQTFPLPSPVDVLTAAVKSLQQSVAQRQLQCSQEDVAVSIDWTHLTQIPALIAASQAALSLQRAETALSGEVLCSESLYTCTMCTYHTNHVSSFRRHCTREHGKRMYRTLNTAIDAFMTDGLPECRFCKHVFTSWRSFRIHTERGCQALLLGPQVCTGVLTKMALPAPAHASKRGDNLLTAQDLHLLLSQPWGPRILQHIANDALENLEHEQEACQYLSRYCCLCGQHLHRTQDVHLHFRTEHAAHWDHVPQKALVLTNLHSSDSPCPHCGGYFRQHKCPVWTQISVLLLHGAGLMASDQMTPPDVVHRCEVCLEVLPDTQQLTQHLKTKHGLAGISFNAARDSLNAQAACAHCGAALSSMESLRSHIVQGRCPSFNPLATAETTPIDPDWVDICINGNAFTKLRAPMARLHLTLRCLHCPQTYKRAGDLANHLMTNHSRFWRQSQRLTLLLVDLIFARHGCTCNPQIHQIQQNHVCLPLRQIAMAFHRLDPAPFMPVPITENVLGHLLHSTIPRDSRFALIQLFGERRFSDLWTLPQVRQMLSTACLMCGHAQEPGLLCRHFYEAHMCTHQFVEFYMETLMPLVRQELTTDYRCDISGQIFNLPALDTDGPDEARSSLVQTHLQGNCPVLIQASLLLATALNGGQVGHEWLGLEHPSADTGHLLVPGTNVRQVTAAATQSETTEMAQDGFTAGRSGRSRSARSRSNAAPAIPPGLGTTCPTTRSQLELAAKHRLFHTVFPAGQGRLTTGVATGDTEMADATPTVSNTETPNAETAPEPMVPAGHVEQSDQGLSEQAGRASVPSMPGEEPHPGGYELDVSTMGCRPEEVAGGQEKGCLDGQDASAHAGAHRGLQRPDAGGEVPGTGHQHTAADDPLETPVEYEDGQALRPPPHPDSQCGVAAGRHFPQSAFNTTESADPAGAEHAATDQGQRQREEQAQRQSSGSAIAMTVEEQHDLRRLTSRMILANNASWCYANTMMFGMLWTLLSLNRADAADWGPHFKSLKQFIHDSMYQPLMLNQYPWFNQLLECWGMPQTQQDCGGFVDMRWERRFVQADQTCCHDHSTAEMPLILHFLDDQVNLPVCTLKNLIGPWHQADGMKTGLLNGAPIICVQIEKMIERHPDQIEKCSCAIDLDHETMIPIFSHSGTQCELISGAGHYQALLKIQPTVVPEASPVEWLVTQDNVCPHPCWTVPTGLSQNLTLIWMVRTDCLQLPPYTDLPVEPVAPESHDVGDLLALLSKSADADSSGWMAPSDTLQ